LGIWGFGDFIGDKQAFEELPEAGPPLVVNSL